MPETIGILGGGRMGSALARWATRSGHPVLLWDRTPEVRQRLAAALGIAVTPAAGEVADRCRTLLLGLPATAVRSVIAEMAERLKPDHEIVHTAKGVGPGFQLVSESIGAESSVRKIAVLGGPLLATELESGHPVAIVVASRFERFVARLRDLFTETRTWLFGSNDVVGIEVAGAMRNVSAIATGMSQGLGMSETTRALIMTRGLFEATRIGVHFGANRDTFMGLAGVGDLVARREATYSRNFRLGLRLSAGEPYAKVIEELGAVVEGVVTARAAVELARRADVPVAVAQAVARVLDGADPRDEIESLLSAELPFGPRASVL